MSDAQSTQIVATVTVPLTGTPPSGLRIISDPSTTDVPASWTAEYAATPGAAGDRVQVTKQNPGIPIVTGTAQIGVGL